jgi:hypothetical protein
MELEVDEEYEPTFNQVLGQMTRFCSKMCGIRYAEETINVKELVTNTEVTGTTSSSKEYLKF